MTSILFGCMTMLLPMLNTPAAMPIAAAGDSISTDYPYLYSFTLQCRVEYSATSKIYSYAYRGDNPASNKGKLWNMRMDISRPSTSILNDTVGLKFFRPFNEESFRDDFNNYSNSTVAISASVLPSRGWYVGCGWGMQLHMGAPNETVSPGSYFTGLELQSKGLPGIRTIVFVPYFEDRLYFYSMDDTVHQWQGFEYQDSIKDMVNFRSRTVGPILPPAQFEPLRWCDTLRNFSQQSREMLWIPADGTLNKYLSHFTHLRTRIQSNDIRGARDTIAQILTELNRDSSGALTSEAYALLRYNTEYLLSQLPP